jgi:hypothetical protein
MVRTLLKIAIPTRLHRDRKNEMKPKNGFAQLFIALMSIFFCYGSLAQSLTGPVTPISLGVQSSGLSGVAYFGLAEYTTVSPAPHCQYNLWFIDTTVVTYTGTEPTTSNNFGRNAYTTLLAASLTGRKIASLSWYTTATSPPSPPTVVCWAYLIQLADQ